MCSLSFKQCIKVVNDDDYFSVISYTVISANCFLSLIKCGVVGVRGWTVIQEVMGSIPNVSNLDLVVHSFTTIMQMHARMVP